MCSEDVLGLWPDQQVQHPSQGKVYDTKYGKVLIGFFCCWVGPVPYLELFWARPVKKSHPVDLENN